MENKYMTKAFIKANPELKLEVTSWITLLTRPDSDLVLEALCNAKKEKG